MIEYEVFFAPEAQDDLQAIYDWIADATSPDTAMSYIERIEAHCLSLKHQAERGHRRDDIRPGLRIFGFERRVTIAFMVVSRVFRTFGSCDDGSLGLIRE